MTRACCRRCKDNEFFGFFLRHDFFAAWCHRREGRGVTWVWTGTAGLDAKRPAQAAKDNLNHMNATMNLKTIAVTALILISYLYSIAAEPEATEAAGSTQTVQDALDADTVGMAGYTELDDFVIVQQKKLVQSDGAKLTYNVTEDPEAGSSNILDILRKVPGVSVDAEDNVKVQPSAIAY